MGARERLIAKFHYTDTDTDTDIFVAKLRWVRAGPFRRKKVRVRVVEFSFKRNIAEKRNGVIAVRKVATPLRELTCHVGSHSVACHPAEVTFPPLPQPKLT